MAEQGLIRGVELGDQSMADHDAAMTQDEVNKQAWNNPANWHGLKLVAFYSSSQDCRLWVRKRIPALGWTINMAHPRAMWALVAFVCGPLITMAAVGIAVLRWDVLSSSPAAWIWLAGSVVLALAAAFANGLVWQRW